MFTAKQHAATAAMAVAAIFSYAQPGQAATVPNVLAQDAVQVANPASKVMLAMSMAGKRLVAVGERGIAVYSDDAGQSWRQAKVPVAVTLTGVAFPTARHGWAIGHGGVILHSADGGASWIKQLDGKSLGQLLLATAKNADAGSLAAATQFAADGPDKPFLDLHFYNERSGIVIGAYGLILRTDDGGKSWTPLSRALDNAKGLHLYALTVSGNSLYVVGEQGFLARSDDEGHSFVRLNSPYRGSYFAVAALPSGEVVVGGLRGTLLRSVGKGASFEPVSGAQHASISGATVLGDGRLVFIDQAGQMLASADQGLSVTPFMPGKPVLLPSAVLAAADGAVYVAGARGVDRLAPRNPNSSATPGAAK